MDQDEDFSAYVSARWSRLVRSSLALGRVRRGRRRALVSYAAGCAVVLAVAAAGSVAIQLSGGQVDAASTSASGHLDVTLDLARTDLAPLPSNEPRADWDTESRTLVYQFGYGSSCPPTGAVAERSDSGEVTLRVAIQRDDTGMCTADARPAVASITGLDAFPQDLTVTDEEGNVETVPVDVPTPMLLSCPDESRVQTSGGLLTRFPKGSRSAEQLVADTSTPEHPWVLSGDRAAYELRPDGTAFALHDIQRGPRGYFFHGYLACSP